MSDANDKVAVLLRHLNLSADQVEAENLAVQLERFGQFKQTVLDTLDFSGNEPVFSLQQKSQPGKERTHD